MIKSHQSFFSVVFKVLVVVRNGVMLEARKHGWVEQKVMSNMTCYLWFERVLYADYDYIRNYLIRSIYMWLLEKNAVFANLSMLNNLYNARVKVNESMVYCWSRLGLQSPEFNCLDLIQNNRTFRRNIISSRTWVTCT